MAFLETPRFTDRIVRSSSGGPGYSTSIVPLLSGHEQRNANWGAGLHQYDVAVGVKDAPDLEDLIAMFHCVGGMANGFRVRDPLDYKSCGILDTPTAFDQALGTGDGSDLTWQLIKTYTVGALSRVRTIQKPDSGLAVLCGVGGVQQSGRFTVDYTTGILTFSANISRTVIAATKGTTTRLQLNSAHTLTSGNSVRLGTFTAPWDVLNGQRTIATVVDADEIDIPINTSALAAWSANAGAINTIPQTGESITAGYLFDVPVRFGIDRLSIALENYRLGQCSVPLIEIRV